VVYSTGLRFNAIYVVESLPPGDLRSGQELYDAVLIPAKHAHPGLHVEYHRVASRAELDAALRKIEHDCATGGRGPLLHIEAHGDTDGLQLGDGAHVPWTALTPQLARINRASRMNLLVLAMMCKGWDLTAALMPSDRAPVFMLIGPPDNLVALDVQAGTTRFYSELFRTWDLNAALTAMNEGRPYEDWFIKPATAEILFCRVFRYYMQDLDAGRSLEERENKLVAEIARERGLTVLETADLRLRIRSHLTDHEWWYSELRRSFLLLDDFPENRSRFGLSYKQCVGE
jgi:hypothetical protein